VGQATTITFKSFDELKALCPRRNLGRAAGDRAGSASDPA
jgi:hypothetical protein